MRTFCIAIGLCAAAANGQGCERAWSSPWTGGDTDAPVRSMVSFDDGTGPALYAAGSFTRVGGAAVRGVAKWTGTNWVSVGAAFDGDVNALAVHTDASGTALYAGGTFRNIGAAPARLVARWNGSAWAGVGGSSALSGYGVRAMVSFADFRGNALWIGGPYPLSVGGASSAAVLRWNGSGWSVESGSGSSSYVPVNAMAVVPEGGTNRLYIGGAPSYPYYGLARWDGSSSWTTVGSPAGTNGTVMTLAAHNDGSGAALYVGGDFTTVGTLSARRIARWNGSAWSAVGAGSDGPVMTLGSLAPGGVSRLYAGGGFLNLGGAKFLAQWDGSAWSGVGTEQPNDAVMAIAARATQLYAAGSFSAVGSTPASRAAVYSPASGWGAIAGANAGDAPSDQVRTLSVFDDDGAGPHGPSLCVGGDFRVIGSLQANHLALWDGAAWSALGAGVSGPVYAARPGLTPGTLIAGGRFATAGDMPAVNVAMWDGSAWSAMGAGLPGLVRGFGVLGGTLFAVGEFGDGGSSLIAVKRWDGAAWVNPAALGGGGSGWCAEVFDDGQGPRLYVGGQALSAQGGSGFEAVLRYTGSAWERPGTPPWSAGFVPVVTSMVVFDDGAGSALYVAGMMTTNLPSANYQVARFKGGAWTMLPPETGGLSYPIQLTVHDDGRGRALYASGPFTSLGGVAANRVAKWNGSAWTPLGSGIDGPVQWASVLAAASFPGDGALYLGGAFMSAGGAAAPRLAKWNSCGCFANCDGSTGAPLLNVLDFVCFLNRFAAQDPYANCDQSTTPPVLNVQDFSCFLNRFAAGCT